MSDYPKSFLRDQPVVRILLGILVLIFLVDGVFNSLFEDSHRELLAGVGLGWGLLIWEGWVARVRGRQKWWLMRVLAGSLGAPLAYGMMFLIIAGFMSPVEFIGWALPLFTSFALAVPGTFILLLMINLWLRRRSEQPATRMEIVTLTMAMCMVPAMVASSFWAGRMLVSGSTAGRKAEDVNRELAEAARRGDTAHVRALLAAGANVNAAPVLFMEYDITELESPRTALMQSAAGKHTDTLRALLAAGANPDWQNYSGETALRLAVNPYSANRSAASTVQALAEAGADVNATYSGTQTILGAAVQGGDLATVRVLLAHGAAIQGALKYAATADMAKVLLDAGADAKLDGPAGLIHAAQNDRADLLWTLLKAGTSARGPEGAEALKIAEENGRTAIVEMLKKAGARRAPPASGPNSPK